MKNILTKIVKGFVYTLAGLVILMAIGVGLLRLFLPRLPEYQEQIKVWASDAMGVRVEFASMDARWGLDGPELEFIDAELLRADTENRIVAAEKVSVSVALLRLLRERTVAIDRILVSDSSIEMNRLEDGSFWIEGNSIDEFVAGYGQGESQSASEIEFVGEDLLLLYSNAGDSRPTEFNVSSIVVRSDEQRVGVDADVRLPDDVGNRLEVVATYFRDMPPGEQFWDVGIEISDLQLRGITGLIKNPDLGFTGGAGDVELSMAIADDGIRTAAASLELDDIALAGVDAFSIRTDLEYRHDVDSWLLAASRMTLTSLNGTWPDTSFRIDAGLNPDGDIHLVGLQADYLNLQDASLFAAFLPDALQSQIRALLPRGTLRSVDGTLSGLDGGSLEYRLSADFEDIGVEENERWPGVRGISGRVRADMSGGRVELRSNDARLSLSRFLPAPVEVGTASGTIIWRHSGDETTILSDNIIIQNMDIDSQTNVHITIDGDSSPVIDLASQWSLTDLGSAKRYIPEKVLHPNLYRWFQQALISGRVDDGRTVFEGPLDKYPFDGGEGRFLLEATLEDSLFRYLEKWPVVELERMEVVLENMQLTTARNRSVTEGRVVENANVSINDLRDPVLRIEGETTGDMQSLLAFSKNSPIDTILGGQLKNIEVSGAADTTLSLTVPLKSSRDFTVRVGILAKDAGLRINGLAPAIENINGRVVIERDDIRAENLVAEFLERQIEIDLSKAAPDMAGYDTVATITGRLESEALASGFKLGLSGLLSGETDYTANVLFPSAQVEPNLPLAIGIASDLDGMSIALPAPLGKDADSRTPLGGDIEVRDGGRRIVTTGQTALLSWNAEFLNDERWDFDRGTIRIGDSADAVPADVRGLDIRGDVSRFHLDEWLNLPGESGNAPNVVDRIRTVDVKVADLKVLGQAYAEHSVRLDRSARDWLIQIDGELAKGSIQLPYEFNANTTVVLEMERLILPGDDSQPASVSRTDPSTLPQITLRAEEFGLGTRRFGKTEADIVHTPTGLRAERIIAVDDSFELFGNGSWVVDEDDPAGSRTTVVGGLRSTDIKATMARLDYQPGINGEELSVLMDLSWSGGPSDDFLKTLSGDVEVTFGPGVLDEVDPGAGRVFGLMSIVALPRRLSLDFSDVFQKGFGFDEITGDFRLDNGDAYTCNLSLEGPAAAIGIVGRAGLDTRDYEQSAIISANFGNSLPLLGAVAAGPQAAAALLIFSQIFKKPLQDLSQVYYDIGGSWEDPNLENSDAAAFAATGKMAGCLETEE